MLSRPDMPPLQAVILEDHEFQRKIGAHVLRLCGAEAVHEAANGNEALALLETLKEPVDVMVCDLNMPGMDGLEFLRHIGLRQSGVSVILASSMDAAIIRAAEMMARSYGVRIIGIAEKPLSEGKLMPLILRHFGQSIAAPRLQTKSMPLADIRAAIAGLQFEPFFQPKVHMHNFALAGVEALMRWRHPTLGLNFAGGVHTGHGIEQPDFRRYVHAVRKGARRVPRMAHRRYRHLDCHQPLGGLAG